MIGTDGVMVSVYGNCVRAAERLCYRIGMVDGKEKNNTEVGGIWRNNEEIMLTLNLRRLIEARC